MMSLVKTSPWLLAFALSLGLARGAAPTALTLQSRSDGAVPVLLGPDASQQLVATMRFDDGSEKDFTRAVRFEAVPHGLVEISPTGAVTPVANGDVVITAEAEGQSAQVSLTVADVEKVQALNFPNEIVPLFTKFGCNGGGCHGKSEGQNGFKLSLLGFEPAEDYDHLVKEGRGRRLFPAAPELSLLMRKGSGELPHGGGSRWKTDSPEYKTLIRWMQQGMPFGNASDPVVKRIEVSPKQRLVSPGDQQQLVVTAHYSDGSTRDVSRVVQYESNQKEMAEVTPTGLVSMGNETGDIAVMIRFQELVDVFRATIPLGAPVDSLPPAKNFIDDLVYQKLEVLGLPPSEPCDDATFMRRVCVDIAGRLPQPEEVESFMLSADPNKRDQWIETLLGSTDYADYFANKWNAILRNKRGKEQDQRRNYAFHSWVRQSLHENKPFDQFVGELVAASGELGHNPAVGWYSAVTKREEQLQDVAQVFLGVRLQCAQCHHHPYEKWSQKDYYSFSAFFSQVGRKKGLQPGEEVIFHRPGKAQDKNKKNGETVFPAALGNEPLDLEPDQDPRVSLAAWMGSPENPFFARMLVNRYWKHFFGRALVEPEDDMRVTNPATNPELLDALAQSFIDSRFDLKELIRTICSSQTYQLSALPNDYNQNDKQNYSRFYPRRLTAEILLDSIDSITGVSTRFAGLPKEAKSMQLPDDSFNASSYFLTVFGRPEMDSACECERTQDANLAQSLHLLNSQGLQEKLTNNDGRANRFVLAKDVPDDQKINELYLRAFSRQPEPDERQMAMAYIAGKRASGEGKPEAEADKREREAYEDLLWTMINTKEFLFNH